VLAEADLTRVGQAAFAAGIAVTELRAADGAGLEEMFLALTAESQRETVTNQQATTTQGAAA
jgi:ABC-2 type transport system ATP-binding protein